MRTLSERRRGRSWSWRQVQERTLAIYQGAGEERLRTAALLWQGDDPRVATADGERPPLLVVTMDLAAEQEPGADNQVELRGFDSLERARRHCTDWTGEATEVAAEALGETGQIGLFAAIREPSFAADH